MLFPIHEVDTDCYRDELEEMLPEAIVDIHTHVWKREHKQYKESEDSRTVNWPRAVAVDDPVEDLVETYALMFPGRNVTPLMFSIVDPGEPFEPLNDYVSSASREHRFPALIFAHPEWTADELVGKVESGGFVGIKVYLNHAPDYLPKNDVRIYDYLPPHQLQIAHELNWIVMLHIPRDGRLADRVNLAQMVEIDRRYPNAQVIIAHVGRAYCPEDLGDAFSILEDTRNLSFDFSANTNQVCFERLLGAVGFERVLFGSDLPISRMRMRRICEDGRYVNIVPRGLYGDVSGDPNMREVDGSDADILTFFLYEELKAFRRAADQAGLTKDALRSVFHENAMRMLSKAGWR